MESPHIVAASTAADIDAARALMLEYAAALGIDLGFQDFEAEMAGLPGDYTAPLGALLLARDEDAWLGVVAMRPLTPGLCEMKRLYVRPTARGRGIGDLLISRVIGAARSAGYGKMRLDTIAALQDQAIALYRRHGFREIPAYRFNPVPGALFMELRL